MSRDLVRAGACGRAATLRGRPGPAGVCADGLFSPAGWDTPTWAQATCGGRVPACRAATCRAVACRAAACGGRPAATSVSRPAYAHGLPKSGMTGLRCGKRVSSVTQTGSARPQQDPSDVTGGNRHGFLLRLQEERLRLQEGVQAGREGVRLQEGREAV